MLDGGAEEIKVGNAEGCTLGVKLGWSDGIGDGIDDGCSDMLVVGCTLG